MSIQIRKAQFPEDSPALHQLTHQLGYPCSLASFQQRMDQLHQHPMYQTWIAELNHQVVGYLGSLVHLSWEHDQQILHIQALVVDENCRGQGVGQHLLAAVEDYCRLQGIGWMIVLSGNRTKRQGAHQFYLHHGFSVSSSAFHKKLTV